MNTTIEVTKKVTTLINILTVEPEHQQKPHQAPCVTNTEMCRQQARWLDLDQLHRRRGSASCTHLLAVARPRIGRGDADQPRYGRLLPEDRRARQLHRGRRLQPPRLMPGERRTNMRNLKGKRVVNTGGSQGLGLAMVEALKRPAGGESQSHLAAIERTSSSAEHAGAAGDCRRRNPQHPYEQGRPRGDARRADPQRRRAAPIKPIDQQNWDEFSTVWNIEGEGRTGRHSGRTPHSMKRSGVVFWSVSSGAAMVLAGAIHRARKLEALRRLHRR